MIRIRMADLNIQIENQYSYTERLCRDYTATFDAPDLVVSVSDEDIEKERKTSPYDVSDGYCESICLYRAISEQLPLYDAFLFHGAVVELDGKAFVFAARSGVGKSTHVSFWLERFGSRARIINGDKPILRYRDGVLMAYGTPWCGKENWQINAGAPVEAICFLERGTENVIYRMEPLLVLERLVAQILIPHNPETLDRFFDLINRAVEQIPLYRLRCLPNVEAAEVAARGMYENIRL